MNVDVLTTAVAQLPAQAAGLSGQLISSGNTLLSAIVLCVLSWEGVKIATEASDINQTMASVINKTLVAGLVMFIFDNYASFFGASGGKPGGLLVQGFTDMGRSLGAPDIMSELPKILQKFLGMAGKILGLDSDPESDTSPKPGWTDVLTMLPDLILAYITRIAAAIVTVIAGAIYIAQMTLAEMAVAIGAIVGPVMIPWVLIPATSWLFDGWLKFMVIAGMWKLVGAVVFVLTNPVITAVTNEVGKQTIDNTKFGDMTLMALGLLVVCVILAFMMAKIPDFAQSLCSGGGVDGLSSRWSARTIMGGATSSSRAAIASGGGVRSAREARGAYQAAKAAGQSTGQAVRAGARFAAQSAGYRMQNMGRVEKPKLPK